MKRAHAELKRLLSEGIGRESIKDIFGSINEDLAKENLIRSPEQIRRVREELAKYETIQAKVSELESLLSQHAGEEKLLDQYIEALYTDTIVKKGALYVYDREEDEESWEPFVNLMKSRSYPHFEIYDVFRSLNDRDRQTLLRKASRRSNELTASEDVSLLVGKLDELYTTFIEARGQLEYEKMELVNGDEAYRFYQETAAKLNELRKRLR